ncbi:MAG: CoA pyrophosphatase [Hyphomicrobium sp.]
MARQSPSEPANRTAEALDGGAAGTPNMTAWPDEQRLDVGELRRRAAAQLLPQPFTAHDFSQLPSDFDLNPDAPGATPPAALKPAAVLIGIVARTELTVLFTERTPHLSAHAGQIAFPGGRIDPTDRDAADAAMREATEEIGLDRALVEPIGYVEPYRTSTGYLVTPVVALIAPHFTLNVNGDEVASVFEVPLALLLDAPRHRVDHLMIKGIERRTYAILHEDRYIWGATAGMVRTLAKRLCRA